ncbi:MULTISPECIES: GNAT family N-acetyltransferase [unclassified Streptomyces]|uniref:GNAT family N-acetyltransferase n=1 Tax=unclassified Streptomyces TaxID=2593676 RepID=UPI00224DC3D8|nr:MULTISPECIES: GNAT family N-acetyltransferase [unclassified Streptomyces]MCX4991031.1 GNAT family N-acetyltransferase [Streptomyces sp. NBC_00568]MCX5003733.1 GNAT family N-acetyltransferase [Streptomyces sp. NBC_00638]
MTIVNSSLGRLEQYYNAVPRAAARAEDFGPLTLFVRESPGWPYYARPTPDWTGPPATAEDVDRVRARQRELGVPEAFEWVAEVTPGLRETVEATGLRVHAHPLMVREDDGPDSSLPAPHPLVRVLGPDDPSLAGALAVPHLAFAAPGTAPGPAGPAELAAEITARAGELPAAAERVRAGRTVVAAAVEDGVVLCSGMHLPVGGVSEVAGVGTLPAARRRGLALAVTAALVTDARTRGVDTVFLSAGDDDVARIYGRLGFRAVATALIAEPGD